MLLLTCSLLPEHWDMSSEAAVNEGSPAMKRSEGRCRGAQEVAGLRDSRGWSAMLAGSRGTPQAARSTDLSVVRAAT